jgi:acyl carrier protein
MGQTDGHTDLDVVVGELRRLVVSDLLIDAARDVAPDASLRDAGVDSLSFLELRVAVEKRYGFEVPLQDFAPRHFATLERLARYILRRRLGDQP